MDACVSRRPIEDASQLIENKLAQRMVEEFRSVHAQTSHVHLPPHPHITALTLTLYSPRFTLSRSGGLELSRPVPAKPAGTPSITQELHRASGQQRMDVVFDFIILIFRSPTSSFDLCCSLLFRPIIRRATRASPGPLTDTHSPGPHHRHALTHVLM